LPSVRRVRGLMDSRSLLMLFALRANGEKDYGRRVADFSQILTGGMASSNGIHAREFSHV